MPETRFGRRLKIIIPLLSVAVFASFAVAGWSLYQGHRDGCHSRNTTLDVLHDVIVLAATPPAGQKLTAAQRLRVAKFETAVFARIDKARC